MKSWLRFLLRNRLYSIIEALGLIVSLAFVALIGTYVWQQWSVAYAVPEHDRIFNVRAENYMGVGFFDKESVEMQVPEVELATRLVKYSDDVKGVARAKSKSTLGKVFIVIQSALAVILITIAFHMEIQMAHVLDRDLQTDTENCWQMLCSVGDDGSDILPLVDRISAIPDVEAVGIGSCFPTSISIRAGFRDKEQKLHSAFTIICDSTYFRILNLRVAEDRGTPLVGAMWLSESAARDFGLSDSTAVDLAGHLRLNGAEASYVGGVFKDFPATPATNLDADENTAILVQKPENIKYNLGLMIKFRPGSKDFKTALDKAFKDFCKERNIYDEPWVNGWLDDIIRESYSSVFRAMRLVEIFTVLAALLSMLGLLAMSAYYAGQIGKDVAVRKVFGSTIGTKELSCVKEYMVLVAFVLLISMGSVLWQTMRVARTDPAVELRKE